VIRRRWIAASSIAALAAAGGVFAIYWLHRARPLPADQLTQIEVQLDASHGSVKAHIVNGSEFHMRDVVVRVFAMRPTAPPDGYGWQIDTSRCTFDPVAKPDGYDMVVDRQIRFASKLAPLSATTSQTNADFVPGSDYWECRIVAADGYR
jgi:hypothetical protein